MGQEKTIKEQIGFLIELQAVDGEIYALNREKKEKPGQIKAIEESLENKKTGIKQAEEDLKTLQVKLKEKEVTLQQKEEQIQKLQTQLYQLKTNKEYSVMTSEIEGIKADNSLVEEEMLRLMDKIDDAKKTIAKEKGLFASEEDSSRKEKDIINARLKEIGARLSGLTAKREEILPDVDKQILARYERILKNKDGFAMTVIEDGACGGCHMNLPPQVINEVKLREDVVICGSCLRILYINDDVEVN